MKVSRSWLPLVLVLLFAASAAWAEQWTGTIVDQKDAIAGQLKGDHTNHITVENPVVFVSQPDNKIYTLRNAGRAETLLGKRVTIQGSLEGSTIKVESVMEIPDRTTGE